LQCSHEVDAIICSDIEIRSYKPLCRLDENYFKTFRRKILFIKKLQKKYNCLILDGGDLFDKKYKVNPSNELLLYAIKNLPNLITIPGNHDLPGHSIKNFKKSPLAILQEVGRIKVAGLDPIEIGNISIYGFPYGEEINQIKLDKKRINVALVHAMIYENSPPFPGCVGFSGKELLKMLPGFDLIVSGHNHQSFIVKMQNRLLVNPGSLLRNDADQIDFEPRVFLWGAKENQLTPVKIPIIKNLVSRQHLVEKEEKEERLSALIEKLGKTKQFDLNFEKNLEICSKKIIQPVKDKIWGYFNG
jgi:DNA repair exonuclease SbcCD nuclease subunit